MYWFQMQRTCDAVIVTAEFQTVNVGPHAVLGLFAIIAALHSAASSIAIILTTNNDEKLNYTGGFLRKNMAISDMLYAFVGGILVAYEQFELVAGLTSR